MGTFDLNQQLQAALQMNKNNKQAAEQELLQQMLDDVEASESVQLHIAQLFDFAIGEAEGFNERIDVALKFEQTLLHTFKRPKDIQEELERKIEEERLLDRTGIKELLLPDADLAPLADMVAKEYVDHYLTEHNVHVTEAKKDELTACVAVSTHKLIVKWLNTEYIPYLRQELKQKRDSAAMEREENAADMLEEAQGSYEQLKLDESTDTNASTIVDEDTLTGSNEYALTGSNGALPTGSNGALPTGSNDASTGSNDAAPTTDNHTQADATEDTLSDIDNDVLSPNTTEDTLSETDNYAFADTSTNAQSDDSVMPLTAQGNSIFTPEADEKLPDGFKSLVEGYGKYAAEVVVARAFPAIDGLKPSQRRLLYTMHLHKVDTLQKSANVCGKVLEFHPHSDAVVYDTAVRMVESAEYTAFPYIKGKGSFSKVYFSAKDSQPAASRYTEIKLSEKAETLFGEMQGVEYVPTEDGHTTEPVTLPVSFPSILVTPQQGIAVGVACDIPSFNFNDVCNATIEYLKTGEITTPLYPDFCSGGEYICNEAEAKKLLRTGKGQIKLRGKWRIEGSSIVITEIPFYSDISSILTKARDMQNVAVANDETDLKGMAIRITCTSKQHVNRVLLELLRDSPLQITRTAIMAVIIDNQPVFTGIRGIVEEWCKYRRTVLKKQYTHDLARVQDEIRAPKAVVDLLGDEDKRKKYLTALGVSVEEAERVLRECLPDAADDVIDYILDMRARQLADSKGCTKKYKALVKEEKQLQKNLKDIDAVIIEQLEQLNKKYKIERRTTVVTDDYSFGHLEKYEKAKAQAEKSKRCYVTIDGLFIKKMMTKPEFDHIVCSADQYILAIDNTGRILRIPLPQVAECSASAVGSYIPKILGIDDNFKILQYMLMEPTDVDFLYATGYASHLDMREWTGTKRITRVSEKGLGVYHAPYLLTAINRNYPYMLCVTKNKAYGVLTTTFEYKSRKAATKLGSVAKGDYIQQVYYLTEEQKELIIEGDAARHLGRCVTFKKGTELNKVIFEECKNNP